MYLEGMNYFHNKYQMILINLTKKLNQYVTFLCTGYFYIVFLQKLRKRYQLW